MRPRSNCTESTANVCIVLYCTGKSLQRELWQIRTLGTDWSFIGETSMTNKTVGAISSLVDLVTRAAQRQFQHRCTQTENTDHRPSTSTVTNSWFYTQLREHRWRFGGHAVGSRYTVGIVSPDARRMLTNLIVGEPFSHQFLQSPSARNWYWFFFLPTSMSDVIHHILLSCGCVYLERLFRST